MRIADSAFPLSGTLLVLVLSGTHLVSGEQPARQGDFGVTLQPFSAGETARQVRPAEVVRVAYYAPRTRMGPVEAVRGVEDDDDSVIPQVESTGAHPTVAGNYALLRNGIAYAPSRAPANVKNAIWAVNSLRRKPYVWGGGHGSFSDYGYDCSGTVSFALHYAGLLDAPMPSSGFLRYGERGRGRWITIYSRNGHTFAVIAGLRLDTTDTRYGGDVGPRWYAEGRNARGFDVRHPAGW